MSETLVHNSIDAPMPEQGIDMPFGNEFLEDDHLRQEAGQVALSHMIELPGANLSDVPTEIPNHNNMGEQSRSLRTGEFVKHAPNFLEQSEDTTRTNVVEYVNGVTEAYNVYTHGKGKKVLTEHESLQGLRSFLENVAEVQQQYNKPMAGQAKSMLENMTYIGEREYNEAAKGIAESWRERLREDPDAQICIITGKITPGMIKSDAYLLDNVLKNMSEQELAEFSGRLVVDPADLTAAPEDTSLILLDDWTISGGQMRAIGGMIRQRFPQYKDRMEVQLITATEKRIGEGITVVPNSWDDKEINMPVSAYYAANAAPKEFASNSEAHITGSHCATDFDFNDDIAVMARMVGTEMPPATNIIRPYREPGVVLEQKARLRGITHYESSLPEDQPLVIKDLHDQSVDIKHTTLDDIY